MNAKQVQEESRDASTYAFITFPRKPFVASLGVHVKSHMRVGVAPGGKVGEDGY